MENDVLTQPVQEEQFNQEVENANEVIATEQTTETYATLSKEELLALLEKEIEVKSIDQLRVITDAIKIAFYKRNKQDVEAAKKIFVDNGGIEEEFKLEADNCEERLKELLNNYRQKRNESNQIIEKQKSDNLEAKLEIIEKLKEIVEASEMSSENTYPQFKELQNDWKAIGAIPKEKLNDIWNSYHFQIESYYNIMKINNELRDLDLKKNLELKMVICEESERLSVLPSFVEAFKQLQELHDKWREIGPVAKEQKDEIWDRFKQASTIINKNHQQYFENLNAEQESNLNIKKELCEKIEAILETTATTRKDWDAQTNEVINIQNIWKTIGFAPKKDNTKIYERFRALCNVFFDNKQQYFKNLKEMFGQNLQKKTEICKQVQLLKDSTNWAETTNEIISLQKQWKEIGSVPSKESDSIWKEFRESCDYFFAKKAEHYKEIEKSYEDIIALKEQIIEELQSFTEENPRTAIESLKEIQRRWSESGYLPTRIQNPLYAKYKEIIDAHFTTFKKGISQHNFENFKSKVTNKSSNLDIFKEKDRLKRKYQKLETDIITLENNIGFFAKSKNATSLIKDIEQKITQAKEELQMTKDKIKHIITEEKNAQNNERE